MSQISAPAVTEEPTAAVKRLTTPVLWALRGCSIFIASSTTTRSPSATVAPSSTATLTMVPCMGEDRLTPDEARTVPAFLVVRRVGVPARARALPACASAAGSTTSSRLPPTSTTTRSVAGPSSPPSAEPAAPSASTVSAKPVSIHVV